MDEKLDKILERMREQVKSGDKETAHIQADGLLIDTLELLAPDNPTVRAIIEAYDDIEKWYA